MQFSLFCLAVNSDGANCTAPMPEWVKAMIDLWVAAAGISAGRLFRCVCRAGKHWGDGVSERLVWHVAKQYARELGVAQLAPHDLRRYAEFRIMPNHPLWAPMAAFVRTKNAA